jgi:hypothetical protein
VKLVSAITAAGKQILVLPTGQKIPGTLVDQKLTTRLASASLPAVLAKAKITKATVFGGTAAVSGVTAAATGTLLPGGTVFLGTTGGAPDTTTRVDTLVITPSSSALTKAASANELAATVERQVFAGDLPRDTTIQARGLTLGTVAPATGALAVGPNGFPIFAGTAAPQSGTNPIGPNGFPELTITGPQTGIQPINPNGFPEVGAAPFSQSGMTRAGTPRDATTPATSAVTTSRAISVTATAPSAITSAPAGVGTMATAASPR